MSAVSAGDYSTGLDMNALLASQPKEIDAKNPDKWSSWSIDFQMSMFAVNMNHAAHNSMVQTLQGIADRVANT